MKQSLQILHPLYFCQISGDVGELTEFSFTVDRDAEITSPSFMLVFSGLTRRIYLSKVRRTRRVATFNTAVDLYDVRRVILELGGLVGGGPNEPGLFPESPQGVVDLSNRYLAVRDDLLRANRDLTPGYFEFHRFSPDSEVPVQFGDALATGFRLFDRTAPVSGHYKGLQEHEIYDLDILSFLGGKNVSLDPYGRYLYYKGDRLLVLHKVDRKLLEKCLGVDLIYNHADERRCVFVQYKCEGNDGKP